MNAWSSSLSVAATRVALSNTHNRNMGECRRMYLTIVRFARGGFNKFFSRRVILSPMRRRNALSIDHLRPNRERRLGGGDADGNRWIDDSTIDHPPAGHRSGTWHNAKHLA